MATKKSSGSVVYSVLFYLFFIFFLLFLPKSFFSRIPPECQTVWIQIRLNILSGQTWIQTFEKAISADDICRQRVKVWGGGAQSLISILQLLEIANFIL